MSVATQNCKSYPIFLNFKDLIVNSKINLRHNWSSIISTEQKGNRLNSDFHLHCM